MLAKVLSAQVGLLSGVSKDLAKCRKRGTPLQEGNPLACGQREGVNSAQVGRLIFISVCTTW